MIKISQYENLLSLYITLIAFIPSIILCFFNKKSRIFDCVASIGMIALVLGLHSRQLKAFLIFVIFEILIIYGFYFFRKRCSSELIYFFVFGITMCPLLIVRSTFLIAGVPILNRIIGFTGISYMCFKIWQLLFEIHDGKIDKLNILDAITFLVFFPSFSSGPIARFDDFKKNYNNPDLANYFEDYFFEGVKRIVIGLFYKFALAFFINTYIIAVLSDEKSLLNIVIYMYAYTLYLFFDFAGYSSIAIGYGRIIGVVVPENFNKPFLACNMKEFWARWHMSLSSWFNDYVFGRFVLNNVRNGLFKNTKVASRWAYLFTMTIMGLWHGFTLHYLIYGFYEGALLVATDFWVKSKRYRAFRKHKAYTLVCRIITFNLIAFGMLLFSGKYIFE